MAHPAGILAYFFQKRSAVSFLEARIDEDIFSSIVIMKGNIINAFLDKEDKWKTCYVMLSDVLGPQLFVFESEKVCTLYLFLALFFFFLTDEWWS